MTTFEKKRRDENRFAELRKAHFRSGALLISAGDLERVKFSAAFREVKFAVCSPPIQRSTSVRYALEVGDRFRGRSFADAAVEVL